MKVISLRLALQTTVFAVVASTGGAEGASAGPIVASGEKKRRGQYRILHGLPWTVRAGLPWISDDAEVSWSNARIPRGPVTRVFRRQAGPKPIHQNGNGAWPQSVNAVSIGGEFQVPQPAAIWGRSEAARRYRRSDL